jgi:hypothetical protein
MENNIINIKMATMTLFLRTYPESKNIGYDIPYLYKLLRGIT